MRLTSHQTVASVRAARRAIAQSGKDSVGFVPTMGALHDGHLSLVKRAKEENEVVIASIFVNPAQFGKGEDLDKYPRQLERDTQLLEDMGVQHLFAPSEPLYGPNFCSYVDPMGFDNTREGQARPGHFRGVATIVTKLFNIVQPTTAYFGQKDAAQCVVIRRLAQDLDIPVDIRIMDTVRDEDGLAMSSRNAYLTPEERKAAPVVYRALQAAQELVRQRQKEQPIPSKDLECAVKSVLQANPLVSDIQYVSVDSYENMMPMDSIGPNDAAIVSLACKIGNVRLIDNILLRA